MFQLVWTIIWHLRIEKEKNISVLGLFQPNFEQVYISWEQHKEKQKLRRLLADHKASIFTPKSGKFLWRIWKIKSSTSSFELVSAKPTHLSYSDGSDKDEPQKKPPEVFCKKGTLRNFTKLSVKLLCQSLFFKKLY